MALSTQDPNNPYPQQPGSAFSFNFKPSTLAQLSANPNQPVAGATSPTGFANFNFQPQQAQTQQQQQNPVGVPAPQLANFGASLVKQGISSGASSLSGITSSINNFGATLGFSNPAAASLGASVSSTAVGGGAIDAYTAASTGLGESVSGAVAAADAAATPGAVGALSGASLSGVLGAAGLGALGGGILAHALGENSLGGSIGGAIGAGAGMAFGAAGAAALGLELGSFAGPVGAIVGGIGGAIFGGMFGNKTAPTSAAEGAYSLGANGSVALTSSGNKHAGSNSGVQSQIASSINQQLSLASALGITLNGDKDISFRAGVNTKYSPSGSPGYIEIGGKEIPFTPGDQASQTNAVNQAAIQLAQLRGATPEQLSKFQSALTNPQQSGTSSAPPSLPNNPQPTGQSDFQKFVEQYKAQQNANAA